MLSSNSVTLGNSPDHWILLFLLFFFCLSTEHTIKSTFRTAERLLFSPSLDHVSQGHKNVLHNLFKLVGKNQLSYVKNDAIPVSKSLLKGSAVSGFMGQDLGDVGGRNTCVSQGEYSSSERNQHTLSVGSQEARS